MSRPASPAVTVQGPAGSVWQTTSATVSVWQLAEQPSPLCVLPSSQVSPVSTLWLPHCGPPGSVWQVEEQPSPSSVLPSSHCSPVSTLWLPHTGPPGSVWQVEEQPSPSSVLPSSHCSPV